eukprot:1157715-Pelagomonas_calceolata.AAC.2
MRVHTLQQGWIDALEVFMHSLLRGLAAFGLLVISTASIPSYTCVTEGTASIARHQYAHAYVNTHACVLADVCAGSTRPPRHRHSRTPSLQGMPESSPSPNPSPAPFAHATMDGLNLRSSSPLRPPQQQDNLPHQANQGQGAGYLAGE